MNKETVIAELQKALEREYNHWHFYTQAAILVCGPHRQEYRDHFTEEAASEAAHIQQFGDLILGLGIAPVSNIHLPDILGGNRSSPYRNVRPLLEHALKLEKEVVENYVHLMDMAEELEANGGQDKIDGRYIHIFLEEQILDSRKSVDHITQLLT